MDSQQCGIQENAMCIELIPFVVVMLVTKKTMMTQQTSLVAVSTWIMLR